MTPRELMAAFEVVADAPDGVKRLRELVLSLAVRGKLLPSAQAEWPTQPLSTLVEEFQNGTSSRGGEGGPPVVVIRLADIKAGQISTDAFRRIDLSPESAQKYELHEGDVLTIRVNGSGDLVGRLVIVGQSAGWCYCDHLIRMRLRSNMVNPRFLQVYASTFEARAHLSSVTVTTAGQKTINQKGLGSLQVPLPPLAEQHRIVARVDELMALLDRLESAHKARDEARRAARDAALAALRDAEDADAVETAWARIAGEMEDLVSGQDDIENIRKAVIELAVRGHLTGSSSRGSTKLDTTEAANSPFPLPPGWRWSTLNSECTHIVDCLHRTPPYSSEGFPAIRTADVVPGKLLIETARRVSEEVYRVQIQRLEPREGDILYSREGERLGIAACVPPNVKCCLSQRMMHLRVANRCVPTYIMWYLNSPTGYRAAVGEVNQTTSPHINMASIRAMTVAVPPLPEQHRIVAKVDALLALCDTLEARLRATRELHAQLAAAAVHHLDV